MLCRSVERGEAARDEILAELPDAAVRVHRCDVSDLATLPDVAADLRREVPGCAPWCTTPGCCRPSAR